jgi:hypothetical protein
MCRVCHAQFDARLPDVSEAEEDACLRPYPGCGAEPFRTLVEEAPDGTVFPLKLLSGVRARVPPGTAGRKGAVLVIGQDPAQHEARFAAMETVTRKRTRRWPAVEFIDRLAMSAPTS